MSIIKMLQERENAVAEMETSIVSDCTFSTVGLSGSYTVRLPITWSDYETTVTMSRQQLQEDLDYARGQEAETPTEVKLRQMEERMCSLMTRVDVLEQENRDQAQRIVMLECERAATQHKFTTVDARLSLVDPYGYEARQRSQIVEDKFSALSSRVTQLETAQVPQNTEVGVGYGDVFEPSRHSWWSRGPDNSILDSRWLSSQIHDRFSSDSSDAIHPDVSFCTAASTCSTSVENNDTRVADIIKQFLASNRTLETSSASSKGLMTLTDVTLSSATGITSQAFAGTHLIRSYA